MKRGRATSVAWWIGIAALPLSIPACSGVDRQSPPELIAGNDACMECGMIINETRFAAGYRDSEGFSRGFDDIGCLARFLDHDTLADEARVWVMDFTAHEWIPAEDAWFVRTDSVQTPMAWGIVAVKDSTRAAILAAGANSVFRYTRLSDETITRTGAGPRTPPTGSKTP